MTVTGCLRYAAEHDGEHGPLAFPCRPACGMAKGTFPERR